MSQGYSSPLSAEFPKSSKLLIKLLLRVLSISLGLNPVIYAYISRNLIIISNSSRLYDYNSSSLPLYLIYLWNSRISVLLLRSRGPPLIVAHIYSFRPNIS